MNKKLRKNLGIFLISLSSATVLLGSGSEKSFMKIISGLM